MIINERLRLDGYDTRVLYPCHVIIFQKLPVLPCHALTWVCFVLPKLQQWGWGDLGPGHFCGKRQEVLVLLQDSWQMTLKSYCGLVVVYRMVHILALWV